MVAWVLLCLSGGRCLPSARVSFLRRGSGDCYGDGTGAAGRRLVVATILGNRVGGLHPNLGVLLVGVLELMRRGVRLLLHRRSDGRRPSFSACTFSDLFACWSLRRASLGATSNFVAASWDGGRLQDIFSGRRRAERPGSSYKDVCVIFLSAKGAFVRCTMQNS